MFIYVYDVPALDAVKIGKGLDPFARMADYAAEHKLSVDALSLRFWDVGAAYDRVERWVHRMIELPRKQHCKALELFEKDGRAYADVVHSIELVLSIAPDAAVDLTPRLLDFPSMEAVSGALRTRLEGREIVALGFLKTVKETVLWEGWVNGEDFARTVLLITYRHPQFVEAVLGAHVTVGGDRLSPRSTVHPHVLRYLEETGRTADITGTYDLRALILEAAELSALPYERIEDVYDTILQFLFGIAMTLGSKPFARYAASAVGSKGYAEGMSRRLKKLGVLEPTLDRDELASIV